MRAGLYVRVSTAEQKKFGLSTANQISALIDFCKKHEYEYKIYDDSGVSARKKYTKRPALMKLLDDIKEGHIQLVCFTRLDRWFRSVGDYYAVNSVLEDNKVPWKAIWEDYSTDTSDGVLKANIMLSVSQAEADRTSEKIKSVMAYKRERGDYIGHAPIGYKVSGVDLIVDEGCKDAMQAFWDTLYETKSVTKARQAAKEKGLFIAKEHSYKVIRRSAYTGVTECGYKCYQYIDEKKHKEILNIVANRTRESTKRCTHYYFNGLLVCGVCGRNMVGKSVKRVHADGEVVWHKKYLCQYGDSSVGSCTPLNISEKKLEKHFLSNMEEILDGVRVEARLVAKDQDEDFDKKKRSLESKLSRLKILFEEGDIDIEEYRIKRDRLREELQDIKFREETRERTVVPELPTYWRDIYEKLDELHRAEFWHNVIREVVITNDTKDNPSVKFL